jgi:single-stranded-DNA-specific exonuclease
MKIWQVNPVAGPAFRAAHPEINPVVLQLLHNRGLTEPKDIEVFFNPPDFYDPFLFKNMAAVVALIIKHIKAGDKIIVYGDYDADGVTAAVILWEALQILHGAAEVYLPDRVAEGYGLNKPALKALADQGAKLVITVDNGTRNKAEAAYARQLGLDIIITDHHSLPEDRADLPNCLQINPADVADSYPWRYLAGVGVSFKLVSALLAKANLPASQKKLISEKCLDLVAIGTVADMVNLLGENRALVKRGLEVLNAGRRPGLQELIKAAKINNGRPLEAWNIGWQIGPRLNAASRLAHANSAFALLTTTDAAEAKKLAGELNERNAHRQRITAEITTAVEAQIDPKNIPLVIIALAGEEEVWNEGVIGLVAGRIAEKYYRPTLIVTRTEEKKGQTVFKASGRSVEEFNLIAAVEEGAEFLDKYGGHPMACGFSLIGEANLDAFRNKILAVATRQLDPAKLHPKLAIDAELKLSEVNLALADALNSLAPYGQENPQPRFVTYDLRLDDIVTMGADKQHIKFRLAVGAASAWALAFGAAAAHQALKIGDRVDLVYYLEVNEFNGRREPQLKIIDLRPTGAKI